MVKIAAFTMMFLILASALIGTGNATGRNGPVNLRQTDQPELLGQLAGKWMLETDVLGDGFISSTFPSSTTPPREIIRQGQKVSLTANLQTAQGSYGQPIKEEFSFTIEKAGEDYSLSVESKSWLNLHQQKLAVVGSALKAEPKISFDGSEMPLTITIELTPPAGHKWDFTLMGRNGKPARWFRLTFKPVSNS